MAVRADHTLLVVDDDVDVRETLADFLQAEGYEVVAACDGAEALSLLRSGAAHPCVILLDLMMPVMNGYEFRAQQKADQTLSKIPVFVLTAGDRIDTQALDVTTIFRKPLDVTHLLSALERHC